jgi:CheY-like chemotaxis protein
VRSREGGVLLACILVVEDEAPLRRIMVLNLVRRGQTVIEAQSVASAQEALGAFAQQFELTLRDLNLPDRTGWDLLRSLEQTDAENHREQAGHARLPAVMIITTVRPTRSRLEAFHPTVLLKPFPIEALLRLIQRTLGTSPAELTGDAADHQMLPEKEGTRDV